MSSVWSHRPYQSSWSERPPDKPEPGETWRNWRMLQRKISTMYADIDSPYLVTVHVNGVPLRMKIDTGSSLSHIWVNFSANVAKQDMGRLLDKFARPGFCCVVWLPTTLRWSNSTKARKESIYEAFNLAGCLWVLASYKSCYKVIAYICSAKIVLHRQHSSSDKHWS